jgi:hypothetical protein
MLSEEESTAFDCDSPESKPCEASPARKPKKYINKTLKNIFIVHWSIVLGQDFQLCVSGEYRHVEPLSKIEVHLAMGTAGEKSVQPMRRTAHKTRLTICPCQPVG